MAGLERAHAPADRRAGRRSPTTAASSKGSPTDTAPASPAEICPAKHPAAGRRHGSAIAGGLLTALGHGSGPANQPGGLDQRNRRDGRPTRQTIGPTSTPRTRPGPRRPPAPPPATARVKLLPPGASPLATLQLDHVRHRHRPLMCARCCAPRGELSLPHSPLSPSRWVKRCGAWCAPRTPRRAPLRGSSARRCAPGRTPTAPDAHHPAEECAASCTTHCCKVYEKGTVITKVGENWGRSGLAPREPSPAEREFERNKARIDSGETFHSRKPSGWRRGASVSGTRSAR